MTIQTRLLEAVEQKQLRALDAQFALAVAGNDNPAVTLAAALLSREAGEGHVCLPLSRLSLSEDAHPLLSAWLGEAGEPADWTECLLASVAVSRGERPTPLVLYGDRLYLNRMWNNERTVARFSVKLTRPSTSMSRGWPRRWRRFFREQKRALTGKKWRRLWR